ncbi:ROK family protein [Marinicrinis lubricantis]|uniref:ROK family protein n=1 Tax=Marinicrinis lubricantis TaxID=2086470 RepID=A0ABW1ILT4_9BACL
MIQIEQRIPNPKSKQIYGLLRKQGVVSKLQLLEQSGLTGSTLTRVLDELLSEGWIEEVGFGESTGGRRPILYRTSPRKGYAFGLDISRIHSKLVLCDLHFNKYDTYTWAMTASMTPERFEENVVGAVEHMLSKHHISRSELLGLGIGAVGPLDQSRGIILEPLYFPAGGWSQVPIVDVLRKALQFPVLLDNGANAALLAEYWCNSGHKAKHMLYVHVGTGLRFSVLSDDHIIYGAVNREDSIGQMIIQSDGISPRDPKGNYGCLESYASIYAIERQARSKMKQGRKSVMSEWVNRLEQLHFAHIIEALKLEDSLAKELVTEAGVYFGIGLANLINILHPERVILGGPLVTRHDLFFETAAETAQQKIYDPVDYEVEFSRSMLGDEGLATGGAVLVVNQLT